MKIKIMTGCLTALLLGCSWLIWSAASVPGEKDIRTAMDLQVKAWNNGDLDGFMAAYWKSPELTFQSGNKRLVGWDTLYAMYKKNYAGEKMGTLEFSDIQVKTIDKKNNLVIGRWKVTAKDSVKEGLFSLIFRYIEKEWKIIHDHSS